MSSIDESARVVARENPSLKEELKFLRDFLKLHDETVKRIISSISESDREVLAKRIKAVISQRKIVVDHVDPPVPEKVFKEYLESLLDLLEAHRQDLAGDAERFEGWLKSLNSVSEVLDLTRDPGKADRVMNDLKISQEFLYNFLLWALQPILSTLASLVGQIDFPWGSATCPICGFETKVGFTTSNNVYMKCTVCGAEWKISGLKCPYCGNTEGDTIEQYSKTKKYALYMCSKCGKYWKIVNEDALKKKVDRRFYDLQTSKLDTVAAKRGYV